MSRSASKEVASLSPLFGEWRKTIQAYDQLVHGRTDEDVSDEDVETVKDVHEILESILRACTKYGRFKDSWNFSAKTGLLHLGQDTTVESVKTGARFTIGIYGREIFLTSTLIACSNVKKMGDEFWTGLIELRSLGAFRYQENAMPYSEEARMVLKDLKNTKSYVFQFMRNYILLEEFDGDSSGLGSLEIAWPLSDSWGEIVGGAARAFRCLYRLNLMLFRHGYDRWAIDPVTMVKIIRGV